MADQRVRRTTGPFAIRVEAGQLMLPDDTGARIENMVPTNEGTLRAVVGPCPYLTTYPNPGGTPVPFVYAGAMHGICHAVINGGQREILLVHSGVTIYEFQGWNRTWFALLGAAGAYKEVTLPAGRGPLFPTQFEVVPNGIIIMPQGCRAYFYDGVEVLPLGYAAAPAAPTGLGPRSGLRLESTSNADNDPGINNQGYAHDGQHFARTGMTPDFGSGRVGTVEKFPGATMGVTDSPGKRDDAAVMGSSGQLLEGRYRAAYQWVDRWANLSPLSERSNSVKFDQQRARWWDETYLARWRDAKVDMVLKQLCWLIEPGPTGTIGGVLARTKDELHAGTLAVFELPPNAAGGLMAFATITDNVTRHYPDNTPDAWLTREPVRPVPVREFKLGCVAFGRFWSANWAGEEGRIHPSMPGRWGTFLEGEELFPDPSGQGVTGMRRAEAGLLVFTETNTFLIRPADDSLGGFTAVTISATVGCIAPSSLATLPDGRVVWLGQRGFHAFDGSRVSTISDPIAYTLRSLNFARAKQAVAAVDPETGEYRCWLPIEAGELNTLCLVFDGTGWRRRTDVTAAAVCVTNDHRRYMLVAGVSTDSVAVARDGVWVLDRVVRSYTPATRTSMVETAWLSSLVAKERKAPLTLYAHLRERNSGSVTVEVMKNWRLTPVTETIDSTADNPLKLHETADPPPFWGSETYDATNTAAANALDARVNTWRRVRPYMRRVSIGTAPVETYKIRFKHTADWEFIGFSVDENPKELGGGRVSP